MYEGSEGRTPARRARGGFRIEPLESRLMLYGPLLFSDDFNQAAGTLPNPTTWKYDTGTENGATYVDNSTTMQIVNDPAALDGKALQLTVYPDPNNAGNYLGARINTSISPVGGQIGYGHVEARIRLPGGPNGAGDGIGCSFWMLGSNYPTVGWPASGETDIMENSGETPGKNGGTLHGPGYQQPGIYANYYLPTGQYFYQGYHLFAVDWTPGVVQFSVDNHVYAVRTRADLPSGGTWVFDHPFFIILGIGRDGGSVDANTVFPQTMNVDYVRAYGRTPVGVPSQLAASAESVNQINLTWADPTNDATTFTLERSKTSSFATLDASYSLADNLGSYRDTGLIAGTTYFYRIQAVSSDTATTTLSNWSYPSSATTWSDGDINTTGGSASFSNDILTQQGGGTTGIAGASDAFNFTSEPTTGNGTLLAEVTSLTNTNSAADAGLMFRNTSDPASAFAGVFVTPANTAMFDDRSIAGGNVIAATIAISALPVWVELVRSGNSFSAYTSSNNATWTQIGATQTIALNSTVFGGAVVTSHSASLCTANFSNVSFSPPLATPALSINSGGSVTGSFSADTDFSGGSTSTSNNAIDTAGQSNPAPTALYQSNRYGSFTYTISGLTAGETYDAQLLFAETYWSAAGSRVFDVIINGDMALANLDMVAESGAENRAITKDLLATATSAGQIVLQFNTDKDNAQLNGLRLIPLPGWITVASGQTDTLSTSTVAPGVTIDDGGDLVLSAGSHLVLTTGALNLLGGGQLDLNDNSLVVRSGNLATLASEIQSGYNGGAFNGPGIISTAAAINAAQLTTIGITPNYNTLGGAIYSSFEGQSVNPNDVLIRYTYYGDANLDGKVDGSDYSLIDNGFLKSLTGWNNGDFNDDGTINGSDYTLIDNAFNRQGAVLTAVVASPTAAVQPTDSWTEFLKKLKRAGWFNGGVTVSREVEQSR